MKTFASDNYSGCLPEVLKYLSESVNLGHAPSYGEDEFTNAAKNLIIEHFGNRQLAIHFVMSGTAANVIALDSLISKTGSIITASSSHLIQHESGGPHRMLGAKIIGIDHNAGKVSPEAVQKACEKERFWGRHATNPEVLSISQPTEFGACYSVDELSELSTLCHEHGLKLHMDGCRLFNAAAFLEVDLDQISFATGVDALSLGGTKNGLMNAEAVLLKQPNLQSDLDYRSKQLLNLQSKHRFLSAQYEVLFSKQLWLKAARSANRAAANLADGLSSRKLAELCFPVETNQIFAYMPSKLANELSEKFHFYIYGPGRKDGELTVRLVTSFDTTDEDVNLLLAATESTKPS